MSEYQDNNIGENMTGFQNNNINGNMGVYKNNDINGNMGVYQNNGINGNMGVYQNNDINGDTGVYQNSDWSGNVQAVKMRFTTSLIEKIMAFVIWPVAYIYVLMIFSDGDAWKIFFGIFVLLYVVMAEIMYWDRKRSWESFAFLAMTAVSALATCFSIGNVWEDGTKLFFTLLFGAYWLLCRSGRLSEGETSHLFIWDGITAFFVMPFKNYPLNIRTIISVFTRRDKADRKKTGIAFGAIAAGLILFFIAISCLKNADENYNALMENITSYIEIDSDFIGKIFLTVILCFYFYGLMGGCYRETAEQVAYRGDNIKNLILKLKKVPGVVWVVMIGLFTVFYVLFFVLQGAYLWDAFSFNLPTQYTFSEYARKGFGDMCSVMVIDFIVWWLASRTSEKMSAVLKGACTAITVESIFFAVIAMLKLIMYIQAYGFTPLRLQSVWLVIVLLYACGCVLVSMFTGRKTAKAWFVGSAASLAILCLI